VDPHITMEVGSEEPPSQEDITKSEGVIAVNISDNSVITNVPINTTTNASSIRDHEDLSSGDIANDTLNVITGNRPSGSQR
jgi:hypothetical protein